MADDRDDDATSDDRVTICASDDDDPIPVLGHELVSVSMAAGTGDAGFHDGAAAEARFFGVHGMLCPCDGRVLVADSYNNSIRLLSADLQEVSTVAGDGEAGHLCLRPVQVSASKNHVTHVIISTEVC